MKKIIILLCFFMPFALMCQSDNTSLRLYGSLNAQNYVSGRFNPSQSPLFSSVADSGIETGGKTQFLRIETIAALVKMNAAFKKDNPGLSILVISSTRNFYDQRSIWEAKWNGSRPVDGININKLNLSPYEKGLKILKYSSMPGTSRHHWGTDFDINSLENSYFSKGKGLVLYKWMTENASDFGFYQPYTAGRNAGYEEEKWHWSYLPLSKYFYQDWMKFYKSNNRFIIENESYSGAEELYSLAPVYVSSINPECI
ncbi:MAG: M15 family metallopeptidase [Spirochaetes bacterium]|nr:M15 family metallopeptidase [Spirochaetota bacterium]